MLRGFTTVTFFADRMDEARAWYTTVFGSEPYFVRGAGPDGGLAYLEWRVGDYQHEFGLLNSRFAPHRTGTQPSDAEPSHAQPSHAQPSGVVLYWAVDDVEDAYRRLLDLGATPHDEPTERGPGFVTASVVDPFGNILGVMFNQHYLDVVGTSAAGDSPRSEASST